MQERPVVFFHIGGHKTGTTFLQNVLWKNRAELRRDGVLYPGKQRAAHIWANHDLRGAAFKDYRAPQVAGAWRRLVAEIRQWGGPAIISQEMFSLSGPEHIAKALRDLEFADVAVVFTARDMARQLPAAWQEWIKNRDTISFAEFLVAVRDPATDAARRFMALHDVPAILARWAGAASPDQVRLITVPPPGSDPALLWQRFAAVVGIDPARYNLRTGKSNTSLGAAEAAVLRKLNEEIAEAGVPQPEYDRLVKFRLAPALAARSGRTRIGLPQDAYDWATDWAKQAVQQLAHAGYRITGDLDELIPASRPAGQDPDTVAAADQLAAAIAGLGILVRPSATGSGGKPGPAGLGARLAKAEHELREHRELTPRQRIRRCLVELSEQVGWLGAARHGYRRVRRRPGDRRR